LPLANFRGAVKSKKARAALPNTVPTPKGRAALSPMNRKTTVAAPHAARSGSKITR
jgi:hypothetical protein